MKIQRIEFENFRNFQEHGEIKCSTDGKVTIIYGKNGDGKTTLHQLFQWILYNEMHFNKTTTDRLYNLKFEQEQEFGAVFEVMGRIDFEHSGRLYSVSRLVRFKKGFPDTERISESFSLVQMDDDNNWKTVDNADEVIEKLLPRGLSEYFFFDGESMIADLRVKGKDSASKLKKALYSMFDLDILDSAIAHIGNTDLKTTVLGKLYLSKGNISSGNEIANLKANIERAENRKQELEDKKLGFIKEKKDANTLITSISEKIGSTKSKSEYEKIRKDLKKQRDVFLNNAKTAQEDFGEAIMDMVPQLFISKAVQDAKKILSLKVSESELPTGLNKALLNHLLSEENCNCICGHKLTDKERDHLRYYFYLMPPKSFASVYHDFARTAKSWGKIFDPDRLEKYIKSVYENNENAAKCDNDIKEHDEEEKKSSDIEDLVITRQKAEDKVNECDENITQLEIEIKKLDIYTKNNKKQFDALTKDSAHGKEVLRQIEIMEKVKESFIDKLSEESSSYSQKLEDNIQDLLNQMLTSKRIVNVSEEFAVRVMDSYKDESKSEGQFAVVSFAYIGGILKLLQSEEHLADKEYPLVLDGPFSKLDPDQRQNVVNTIPEFAPQVIIFSKDDLQDVFDKEKIGRVWTIQSNDEKNAASVKEGYLWK